MKSRVPWVIALAIAAAAPALAAYRTALAGYRYEFPRDHFDHPEFQTEWWYYTGNLRTAEGRRFGFELTFFRHTVAPDAETGSSPWTVRDLYLAHFAISDLDGRRFLHDTRANRAGPGIAGVDRAAGRIWNGNWSVHIDGRRQHLRGLTERVDLQLALVSTKAPVIHGIDGVSQKASAAGRASHYVSLTRLSASGSIDLLGTRYEVEGAAWMDHEFFTNQLDRGQRGWDWLGLQLDDGSEVMLYRIRREDGTVDPFSAGTYVDKAGRSVHLKAADFELSPGGENWTSPETGATYPVSWHVLVPSLGLALDLRTPLPSQELTGGSGFTPTYWEGSVTAAGRKAGRAATGVGYLEMTGYDRAVVFGGAER